MFAGSIGINEDLLPTLVFCEAMLASVADGCWLTRLCFYEFVEREGSRGAEEEKCAVVNILDTRIGESPSLQKEIVFEGAEGVVNCQAWWLREA